MSSNTTNGSQFRVVITGAGVITGMGTGWQANAAGLTTARRCFSKVKGFDVERQRVKVASEVEIPATLPRTRLSSRQLARLDRGGKLLLFAAAEAWEQSGWGAQENLPIILGTTGGGMSHGQDYYRQAIDTPSRKRSQPTRVVHYQPGQQASLITEAFGSSGPVTIIANACASGANAIGHAYDQIRFGYTQRAMAGGYDALCLLIFSGFDTLQALSPTQCRPFDKQRDGLALGEGAAVLTLEELGSATRRGALILGEIRGYASTTDTHHLTQPHPEGAAAFATMTAACAQAEIDPARVDYLNAHGTGTPLNDAAEAQAINGWAGDSAPSLAVSSTKASIGHLLGAAGAVEAVICLMALREQWLPPQAALTELDPVCRFPIVRSPEERRIRHALSNSFGFGGANASLVLRRWE